MSAVFSKLVTCILMLVFGVFFAFHQMPDYYHMAPNDSYRWAVTLLALSFAQSMMTVAAIAGCNRCRVWSDFLLQVTGLVFIILGGLFSATYPPFSWAMWVFPLAGILCLTTGRDFSRYSRNKLMEESRDG